MNGDSSDMFRDLSKLKEIDLSNFNTKNVTRMD
jgi:surface protein